MHPGWPVGVSLLGYALDLGGFLLLVSDVLKANRLVIEQLPRPRPVAIEANEGLIDGGTFDDPNSGRFELRGVITETDPERITQEIARRRLLWRGAWIAGAGIVLQAIGTAMQLLTTPAASG